MGLRDMYAYAIQTAKGKFHGNAEERDGKLYFKGTVATEAEKNEIWTAIKTIPTWQKDVVADIQVTGAPAAPAASSAKTYTVKSGDTLSGIAKEHLGSAHSSGRHRGRAGPGIFAIVIDPVRSVRAENRRPP